MTIPLPYKETVMSTKAQIVNSGVDWLTIVSPRTSELHEIVLSSWYDHLATIKQETGMVTPASALGYTGLSAEGIFIGTRYDGAMLRLSGVLAARLFCDLRTEECSVTRLDLQVTVQWDGRGTRPTDKVVQQAIAANEGLSVGRRRKVAQHVDSDGGHTVYVGSRQSTSFARVYDKSVESKGDYPEGCYRYEVQYNRDLAPDMVRELIVSRETIQVNVIAWVWDWFERRGVVPPFRRGDREVVTQSVTIPLTTIDKKLAWLYNQVRPTIETLLQAGRETELLVALFGVTVGNEIAQIWVRGSGANDQELSAAEGNLKQWSDHDEE